jgi:hypothetical protein
MDEVRAERRIRQGRGCVNALDVLGSDGKSTKLDWAKGTTQNALNCPFQGL